jgi:hypothetical protein
MRSTFWRSHLARSSSHCPALVQRHISYVYNCYNLTSDMFLIGGKQEKREGPRKQLTRNVVVTWRNSLFGFVRSWNCCILTLICQFHTHCKGGRIPERQETIFSSTCRLGQIIPPLRGQNKYSGYTGWTPELSTRSNNMICIFIYSIYHWNEGTSQSVSDADYYHN